MKIGSIIIFLISINLLIYESNCYKNFRGTKRKPPSLKEVSLVSKFVAGTIVDGAKSLVTSPKKLKNIGEDLGNAVKSFRKAMEDAENTVKNDEKNT